MGRRIDSSSRVFAEEYNDSINPLFFNPSHDVNVAPPGKPAITAVEHLEARYKETYLHLTEE